LLEDMFVIHAGLAIGLSALLADYRSGTV